ncbi:unnamed protein product [Rhizophagus irregularis]|nr:unnamed protein product [Rhizophagus irregularis]
MTFPEVKKKRRKKRTIYLAICSRAVHLAFRLGKLDALCLYLIKFKVNFLKGDTPIRFQLPSSFGYWISAFGFFGILDFGFPDSFGYWISAFWVLLDIGFQLPGFLKYWVNFGFPGSLGYWISVWKRILLEFTLKKRTNVSFLFFFVDFSFPCSLDIGFRLPGFF